MQDTYQATWNKLLLRCPQLSPKLAQDFIVTAFRRLNEQRRWSWNVKFNQFIAQNAYNTGLVSVTNGFTTIIGTGTNWTADLVGRQFRVGLAAPIYTIAQFDSPTQMELDQVFGGPTTTNAGYSIYQCYFTPPNDFHQFISIWDPAFNWQLFQDVSQTEINMWDAQRANTGNAYIVSFRGYTTSQVGIVSPILAATGLGDSPISSGQYLGPNNALFTIAISVQGPSGTAQFSWRKDNGVATTGVLTDVGGAPQDLMDGVQISFPVGLNYALDDIFIIQTTATPNAGLPFYELWPHQQAAHVYPFLYEAVPQDLNEPNAVLPIYIKSNFLVDMALEDLCFWPGPSEDKMNPYFSPNTGMYYKRRNEKQINDLEVRDDEVFVQDLSYAYPGMSWAMATPLGDARWLQSHAV